VPSPIQTHLPQEYLDLLDSLTKRVEQLSRAVVAPYELTDPLTIGGPTGVYALANPYQTPCEYSLLSFASFDAASALVSTQRNLPQLAATGSLSAAGGMADPGSQTIVLTTNAQITIPCADQWFPLADSENLTMAVTVATSKSAFVTVQFRRRKTPAGVVVF
jgi:hypothetical protein